MGGQNNKTTARNNLDVKLHHENQLFLGFEIKMKLR